MGDTGYKQWTQWITRICERLGLKRGKNGSRPYVSDQTVDIRAQFNKTVELLQQPLKVGDRVLSDGDLYELTQIGDCHNTRTQVFSNVSQ